MHLHNVTFNSETFLLLLIVCFSRTVDGCNDFFDMPLNLIKDCGDIWNRLFDHRPFLSGEIKYFIQEFEESRGDQEISKLENISEWIEDIKSEFIPEAVDTVSDLTKLNTLLGIANETCDTVLEEEYFDIDKELSHKREIRKAKREKFNEHIAEKYAELDKKFDEQEKVVIQFYENLEKKLIE